MWEGWRPASRRAFHAPAWARVFAPPPPKTATTLLTGARIESPVHHPRRAPLRRPVIPPLLVRRLGHDRRYLRRHALLIQRHIRHVARIGVPPHAREHVLGDDLDAHFHGCTAGEVDAGVRGQDLAHVDRLLKSTLSTDTVTHGFEA